MLPADKKEVQVNLSVPDLYFYLINSSSGTRKHFANQRQITQQLPKFLQYCYKLLYWYRYNRAYTQYCTTGQTYSTGTTGHTYSTVHRLATGRQGCS